MPKAGSPPSLISTAGVNEKEKKKKWGAGTFAILTNEIKKKQNVSKEEKEKR